MDDGDVLRGSCLCGDIVFELSSKPKSLMHCHCSMCRKLHGSAFATFGVFDPEEVNWVKGSDKVNRYISSEYGSRCFCGKCGSVVPSPTQEEGIAYIPMGIVSGDSGEPEALHLFVGSRAPWHEISDGHEQHTEWPPGWDNSIQVNPETRETENPNCTGGSCQCGVVRFEYEGEPDRMLNCHCSRCRRQMGAAYGTFIFVSSERFRWISGEADVENYKMPEARVKGTAFCRHCGSLVARERDAGSMQIPAGSLDGDPRIRPIANIFTDSKASWIALDESIACFPEYPN